MTIVDAAGGLVAILIFVLFVAAVASAIANDKERNRKTLARRKPMPKKKKAPVPKSGHELKYPDKLHKKLVAEAKQEGLTNSEMLAVILKDRYYPKRARG